MVVNVHGGRDHGEMRVTKQADLAVVGSGAAAFAAAIRASDLGARVAMVERGEVGGVREHRLCAVEDPDSRR